MNQANSEFEQNGMDDEIDLVELFLILWKRKWMIVTLTLCVTVTGGLYSFFKTTSYEYVTTLVVGTILVSEEDQTERIPVEGPEVVKIKLDQVYIPIAVNEFLDETAGRRLKAETSVQKNSNILLVKSAGPADQRAIYKKFHQLIIDPVIQEHGQLISATLKEYQLMVDRANLKLKELEDPQIFTFDEKVLEGDINEAEFRLVHLDDENKLLQSKQQRLLDTQEILKKQIVKIEKNLELSFAKRPKATQEADDEAKALTFLMINNQIEYNENRLASLQERLYVDLENQKQLLENQIADNRRSRELQKKNVAELQSKLVRMRAIRSSSLDQQKNVIADAESKMDLFQNSSALGLAQRSLEPKGPGKSIVVALAFVLGFMGSIMLAFIAEFMTKVRQQQVQIH
ncbi:MAG: hypothetical protein JXQ81_02250 [Desulfuromonadales bacterium]|nr:hypothetical protein [Desulfuromonadales bacterium]MBN2791308.1 hypothetical protein [Desulfuromonadales bacterium]